MSHYARGTRFEHKVRDHLMALGYSVLRAAGSKGDSKVDLVAFHPYRPMLLIQCKIDGKISVAEWNRVREVAGWYGPLCVPVLAQNGPNGQGVVYYRLTGERVSRSRSRPCEAFDPAVILRPVGMIVT